MKPRAIVAASLIACFAGGSARAQSVPMKAGFRFVLGDYRPFDGFSIDDDALDTDRSTDTVLVRRILLSEGPAALRVNVAVSRVAGDSMDDLFSHFEGMSDLAPEDRLVPGSSVGIAFGDKCFVGAGSFGSEVLGAVAFRRQNVFVSIDDVGTDSKNLFAMAAAIDGAIAALPNVTLVELEQRRPVIRRFEASRTRLKAGDKALLRLKGAPRVPAASAVKTYVTADGDVVDGPPEVYFAGGVPGTQVLRVIVSTPELLFDTAQIQFTVDAP